MAMNATTSPPRADHRICRRWSWDEATDINPCQSKNQALGLRTLSSRSVMPADASSRDEGALFVRVCRFLSSAEGRTTLNRTTWVGLDVAVPRSMAQPRPKDPQPGPDQPAPPLPPDEPTPPPVDDPPAEPKPPYTVKRRHDP